MRSRGFTLIELLVVISIVALLSSVVLASLNTAREKARIAAGLAFQGQLYRTYGANTGGLWRFENAGVPGFDSSGNNSTGNLGSGATIISGPGNTPTGTGSALNGDLNIPTTSNPVLAAATDPGNIFVFATWFKSLGLPSQSSGYIIFRAGNHEGPYIAQSNGTLGATVQFSDGTGMSVGSAANINDGKWHYIAFLIDDQQKVAYLYLDGAQVGKGTYSKTLRTYNTVDFKIGGSGIPWNALGMTDDAMFFVQQ